jgi:acyl-CoA-binding protein
MNAILEHSEDGTIDDLLNMIQKYAWRARWASMEARAWSNLQTWVNALASLSGLSPEQEKRAYDTGVLCALAIDRGQNHRPHLLALQALFYDRTFGDWDSDRERACVRGAIDEHLAKRMGAEPS